MYNEKIFKPLALGEQRHADFKDDEKKYQLDLVPQGPTLAHSPISAPSVHRGAMTSS